MNKAVKGTLCGILAAVSYGTNPLGALSLYHAGIGAGSVLFYRFAIATVVMAALLAINRISFRVSLRELLLLALLGVIFSTSSLTLYFSFCFMDAGIASTLLFVYPVMVAVIMSLFFKERMTYVTVLSILLALSGIALLYNGGGVTLNVIGVLLVMLSSLSYAVYIVIVNRSSMRISTFKLNFYVILFGTLTVFSHTVISGGHIQMLTTPKMWSSALLLALLPTVLSLVLMTVAVHNIGSTPTAIMGALEPVTAVAIGVVVFGEHFTSRLALGILLILFAVLLIVCGKSLTPHRVMVAVGSARRLLKKTWRWKS